MTISRRKLPFGGPSFFFSPFGGDELHPNDAEVFHSQGAVVVVVHKAKSFWGPKCKVPSYEKSNLHKAVLREQFLVKNPWLYFSWGGTLHLGFQNDWPRHKSGSEHVHCRVIWRSIRREEIFISSNGEA